MALFILDSERSDECTDFTMMCFFLVFCLSSPCNGVKVFQFSTLGVVFGRKVVVVGTLAGKM